MTEVAQAHLQTLTVTEIEAGVRRERYSVADFLTFFIAPALLGLGLSLAKIRAPGVDALLAAIAVLTGLLFALLVLMFERVVHERDQDAPRAGNDPMVDAWQLLANVSWAILMSLLLLGVLFGAALFASPTGVAPWLTGAIVGLFAHLGLTLLMILKRVFFMAMRIAGYRRLTETKR